MCSHHQLYKHLHQLSHQVLHCYINGNAFCYVQHSQEHFTILTPLSLHQHSTNPGHQVAMAPIQFVTVCGISEDYIRNCVLCHWKCQFRQHFVTKHLTQCHQQNQFSIVLKFVEKTPHLCHNWCGGQSDSSISDVCWTVHRCDNWRIKTN